MKKLSLFMHVLFLLAVILSCGKHNSFPAFTPPAGTADSTTIQYGTPFANVPDRRDAVIYQVNMRVFSQTGNFSGVAARLDSIKALGANVIYLMPTYPVGTLNGVNSPYCIKDYMSVNSEFGTLADLRTLVEEAHNRNLSVMMDWVANHTAWDHPWITQHKDWYMQNASGNIISPPGTGWNDVAQLNFNSMAMRQAMIKAMKYWVYAANIDGFRCDFADGPPVDFWQQAIDTLRRISTHKLLLLAEGERAANYSLGFDFNFGFRFFKTLKDVYAANRSAKVIDTLNTEEYTGANTDQRMVRYTSNHDVNSSDGTPLDLFGGTKGSMASFAVISYMKSVPMIYNGQEVGTPIRLTFPFTSTKIDWSINPSITAEYKKLIAFRNGSAAVRRGVLQTYTDNDVCSFTKELNGEKVWVLANLRNSPVTYTIPAALANSTWKDGFSGGSVAIGSTITIQPYAYLVLKNN